MCWLIVSWWLDVLYCFIFRPKGQLVWIWIKNKEWADILVCLSSAICESSHTVIITSNKGYRMWEIPSRKYTLLLPFTEQNSIKVAPCRPWCTTEQLDRFSRVSSLRNSLLSDSLVTFFKWYKNHQNTSFNINSKDGDPFSQAAKKKSHQKN